MNTRPKIPYVQSAASQDVPPPYHFPGVTVNAFVWDAEMAPIQAYCDRFFNLGPEEERGFVYKPAAFWPYVTMLFINYPEMVSSPRYRENTGPELGYNYRGVVSQTEVFVVMPVVRYGTTPGKLLLDTTLEWVLPFIVVGEPMSAVCGREMLGLEKLLAQIDTGESRFPGSFCGRVSLPGWRSDTPNVMQEMLRFIDVNTDPVLPTFWGRPPATSPATLLQSRQARWMIEGLGTAGDFYDSVSMLPNPMNMRTISLKQFRDAAQPDRAIYQALVSCRSRYSDIENFQFYNERDVTIDFHDQGSFREILKVFLKLEGATPSGKRIQVKPRAAYRFNATIDFDEMEVVHTFPVERGPGLPPWPVNSHLTARWARPWLGFFGRPHR